jgi:hypothetical protein
MGAKCSHFVHILGLEISPIAPKSGAGSGVTHG